MNYTIAETYELPSNGEIYTPKIDPLIKLTSMNTAHELQRLNKTDRPLKNMADIIDDCIVDKPGISAYDMCISDYQFLLHKIRVVTYGPDYKYQTTCPVCGQVNESVLNLDEVEVIKFNNDLRKYLSFELPKTKDLITIKIVTPRIIDNIQIKIKEKKKSMPGYAGSFDFLVSLMNYIETVNGNQLNDYELEQYIMKLPMADSNFISNNADAFVKSFGIKNEIETECSLCGLEYRSPFRITDEFYRPSL